jgi:hypothetical protein
MLGQDTISIRLLLWKRRRIPGPSVAEWQQNEVFRGTKMLQRSTLAPPSIIHVDDALPETHPLGCSASIFGKLDSSDR